MADVCEPLLFGEIEHIVEHCWEVVVAHLVEGELPELFPSRIENRVLPAVGVAPKVSHPHVVASVGKYEACRLVCVNADIDYSDSSYYPVPCLEVPAPSQQTSKANRVGEKPPGRRPSPPW